MFFEKKSPHCHSREMPALDPIGGGNPDLQEVNASNLDSRFRGNDNLKRLRFIGM